MWGKAKGCCCSAWAQPMFWAACQVSWTYYYPTITHLNPSWTISAHQKSYQHSLLVIQYQKMLWARHKILPWPIKLVPTWFQPQSKQASPKPMYGLTNKTISENDYLRIYSGLQLTASLRSCTCSPAVRSRRPSPLSRNTFLLWVDFLSPPDPFVS